MAASLATGANRSSSEKLAGLVYKIQKLINRPRIHAVETPAPSHVTTRERDVPANLLEKMTPGNVCQAAHTLRLAKLPLRKTSPPVRLSCEFPFDFPITNVQKPIIGAYFLPRFPLFVNVKDRPLHDNLLSFHIICADNIPDSIAPRVLLPISNVFSNILSEFPAAFRV
ncbi:hypothetical protein ACTXT7_012277 [Hymenolepis weldensis]